MRFKSETELGLFEFTLKCIFFKFKGYDLISLPSLLFQIIYGETSGKKLSNALNNNHPYSTIVKILKDQKVKKRKTASKKGSFISVEFDISTSSSSSKMVSQIIGDKIKKANVFYRDEKEFYLDFTGDGGDSTYNENDCVNEVIRLFIL